MSPLSEGYVKIILQAVSSGSKMESLQYAELTLEGLIGDRYSNGLGKWSSWPDQSGKALTIIESEILEEVNLDASQVRRNVITTGIRLETLLGKRFQIGTTWCLGVRPCLPCRYLEGFAREGVREQLAGIRGGLRVDVVRPGNLSVGDRISLLL